MKTGLLASYNKCKRIFDSLKVAHEVFLKLPDIFKFALNFAVLTAVRDAIRAHDTDEVTKQKDYFFVTFLLGSIAEAVYNSAEITMRHLNKDE